MALTDIRSEVRPEPLDTRQIRDRVRTIVSAGLGLASPAHLNFIGALLHRSLDPELDPDFAQPVYMIVLDEKILIRFMLQMGSNHMSLPMSFFPTDLEYYVCRGVLQVRGVFLKLTFADDLIVAVRASTREVASIMKAEKASLRSKWSEEERKAQQVKVRLEPDLLARVELQAARSGMSRNAWITKTLKNALPKP